MSLSLLKKNFVDFPKIACHVQTRYMMLNIDPTVTVAFSETFIRMVLCLNKWNEKLKSLFCGLTTVLPDTPVARLWNCHMTSSCHICVGIWTGASYDLTFFYISLTVHLGIILVNNQLDTLFSMYLFISLLYMFWATQRSSSGESNCINTLSGIYHSV